MDLITKDKQYYKFCFYGFLKNLRFFDAFLIIFLIEKGMSFTEIGILYATREIIINVFEIPSGILADTYGRKNSLIASFIAYIISFLVFYISNEFWFFAFAFILYGIGDAFRTGTHKGMIMDYLKINDWASQKISYYGNTRSWSQKGSAVSSLIAGIIVYFSENYEYIFLVSIVPYILNLILITSYPKELNYSNHQKISNNKNSLISTIQAFYSIIKRPNVLKIINTSAVHSAYLKAVKDYIQPLMVNIALIIPIMVNIDTEKKNGILVGVIYFIIYLITAKASQFSSKVATENKKNISFITLLLGFGAGILCGIFYTFDLWIIAIIAFVGIYIIENIRKPILTGYISDNVPNEILTSVISVQSQLKTIITVLIALAFGIIADNFGIGISFIVVSLFLLISTILLNLIVQNKKARKN